MKLIYIFLILVTCECFAGSIYFREWDPADVIDSSKLIAVVEPMSPPKQQPVGIVPGNPIGTIMELSLLEVLHGNKALTGSIFVFQPAAGIHEMQIFDAKKFVLFLQDIGADDRAMLKKLRPVEFPEIRKKFLLLGNDDLIWTLAAPVHQWMAYYPLEEKLGSRTPSRLRSSLTKVGVTSMQDPVEYIRKLIRIRQSPEAFRQELLQSEDRFIKEAASKPRRKAAPGD